MRIVLTGGGTGGHVSTQVAVLERLLKYKNMQVLYIGSPDSVEQDAASSMGVEFQAITAGKLRRYLSLQNLKTPIEFLTGCMQSYRICTRFDPDIVFSTGGYVALPVVAAAWCRKVPVVIHEQTTLLGLANRLSARVAKKILLSYPRLVQKFPFDKVKVTGNPVRSIVLEGSKTRALQLLDFDRRMPTVLIMGGAQGAHFLNQIILDQLEKWLSICQLIIVTGASGPRQLNDFDSFREKRNTLSYEHKKRLRIFDYVHGEIGDIYKLADLVVARAGAGTIAELIALRQPSILIPLPQSAGGEQLENAQMLARVGACIVLDQAEVESGSSEGGQLLAKAQQLLDNPHQLADMSSGMQNVPYDDPAQSIVTEIFKLVDSR